MPDTSSEKLVKKACSAKKGAPKPKYLDPIILTTQNRDGPIPDICASLSRYLREPNVHSVFKSLLVIHSMFRSGGTDNVLGYLSTSDALRLKNVGQGTFWDGYSQGPILTFYAHYLQTRITAYKELKHDVVRVQAENNRASIYRNQTEGVSERARKLKSLTVEKGLLRETQQVQKVIDSLVKCEFYLQDVQDECVILAFRMMVKDLLVLFQAGNEGIINLLEHYFEMSFKDAKDALGLYKHFCSQTKQVMEYLKQARDINNLIDVPIPNLKHAPVSLVKALQEYLDDPNFEQNRTEYKENKGVVDGKSPQKDVTISAPSNQASSSSAVPTSAPSAPASSGNQALVDFFSSIEDNSSAQPAVQYSQGNDMNQFNSQQPMNPQGGFNPFSALIQQQQPMFPQATGFAQGGMMPLQAQQTGFAAFGGGGMMGQPQQGFLQPQQTGFNPFRQSTLQPQATGFPSFGQAPPMPPMPTGSALNGQPQMQQQQQQPSSPFEFLSQPPPQQQQQQSNPFSFLQSQPTGAIQQPQPTSFQQTTQSVQVQKTGTNPFARPSSTPLLSQPTGNGPSKNPFGIPSTMTGNSKPADPASKGPSLNDLAFGSWQSSSQQQQLPFGVSASSIATSSSANSGTDMSSLASSFAINRPASAGASTSLSSSSIQQPQQPLRPQSTGFAGSSVQPFKPSSSFGASLLSSLPEIPASSPGGGAQGSLMPQQTGTPNPFRQSTLPASLPSFTGGNGLPTSSSAFGGSFTQSPSGTGGPTGFGNSFFSSNSNSAGGTNGAAPPLAPQVTGFPAFKPTSNFGMSFSSGGH